MRKTPWASRTSTAPRRSPSARWANSASTGTCRSPTTRASQRRWWSARLELRRTAYLAGTIGAAEQPHVRRVAGRGADAAGGGRTLASAVLGELHAGGVGCTGPGCCSWSVEQRRRCAVCGRAPGGPGVRVHAWRRPAWCTRRPGRPSWPPGDTWTRSARWSNCVGPTWSTASSASVGDAGLRAGVVRRACADAGVTVVAVPAIGAGRGRRAGVRRRSGAAGMTRPGCVRRDDRAAGVTGAAGTTGAVA